MVSDPSISSSSTAASAAYWEPPADAQPQQGDLNQNAIPAATDSQGTDLVERFLPALDPAIPVSGSSSNPSERTQRTTPDGKRIQVDTLHTGDQATIARERTQVSGGGVSNDLVFTTNGSADDNVQVSQRSDGTVVVNVNGEEYDVALAQRQELTLRVGAGDDVITVATPTRTPPARRSTR